MQHLSLLLLVPAEQQGRMLAVAVCCVCWVCCGRHCTCRYGGWLE